MDGSDGQMLTTTDASISSGLPGMYFWASSDITDVEVTAWEGGDIGAAAGAGGPLVGGKLVNGLLIGSLAG